MKDDRNMICDNCKHTKYWHTWGHDQLKECASYVFYPDRDKGEFCKCLEFVYSFEEFIEINRLTLSNEKDIKDV